MHRSARPRILLCINPSSGAGRGAGVGAEAAARLRSGGADVEILGVPQGGNGEPRQCYADALADRLVPGGAADRRRPDAVVVAGGDGMVHATVNVLAGTGLPTLRKDLALVELAALPQAVPAGPEFAGTVDDRGESGETPDTVRRYVVSGVNVAFDAAANATANRMGWPRGRFRYVAAVLVELLRYRPADLTIRIDGPDGPGLTGPAFLFAGSHTDLPEVDIRPARTVRIDRASSSTGHAATWAGTGPVLHGDGEPLGLLPATVTIAPGRLTVLDGVSLTDSEQVADLVHQ